MIRAGLRRYGTSADGVPLANGRDCARCRAKDAAEDKRDARELERARAAKPYTVDQLIDAIFKEQP